MTIAESTTADYKVADISLADFGRKEITPRRARDARPDGHAQEIRRAKPLKGARITGLAPHDHADGRADRDARRRSAPRSAGRAATSSPPRTTPRRPSPRPACPVFAWKGETLEEYWWCTEQALSWPDGDGPEHDPRRRRRRNAAGAQGHRVREGRSRAGPVERRFRGVPGGAGAAAAHAGRGPAALDPHRRGDPGRDRGDHHRRSPALRDAGGRHAAVPGHQRERLGDEVEVRQPLRLPPLADRRHQPWHRRDDRRQDRA